MSKQIQRIQIHCMSIDYKLSILMQYLVNRLLAVQFTCTLSLRRVDFGKIRPYWLINYELERSLAATPHAQQNYLNTFTAVVYSPCSMLCLKKPYPCDIFLNISNKSGPIFIIFGTENHQWIFSLRIQNWIVEFDKTGYRLCLFPCQLTTAYNLHFA